MTTSQRLPKSTAASVYTAAATVTWWTRNFHTGAQVQDMKLYASIEEAEAALAIAKTHKSKFGVTLNIMHKEPTREEMTEKQRIQKDDFNGCWCPEAGRYIVTAKSDDLYF